MKLSEEDARLILKFMQDLSSLTDHFDYNLEEELNEMIKKFEITLDNK